MHTPGPWVNDPHNTGAIGDVSESATGTCVAQAQARQPLAAGKPDVERAANARLIAAAPEMLEALEQAASSFDSIRGAVESNQVVDKDVHGLAVARMNEIRAVIAKARGEG